MSESRKDENSILLDIYREVGETKISVSNMDGKLEKHIQFSLEEFNKINNLDQEQNRSLDRHIEGVNTLKELYIAHRIETIEQLQILRDTLKVQKEEASATIKASIARIESLEKPYDLIKYIGKVTVWVGAIGTALSAIIAILKMAWDYI